MINNIDFYYMICYNNNINNYLNNLFHNFYNMKKFLITLIAVLAFVPSAFAVDHFDNGYRAESESGYLYLTSAKSTIFVCDGRYITSLGNTNVNCLTDNEIKSIRAKTRTSRFFTRVAEVGKWLSK